LAFQTHIAIGSKIFTVQRLNVMTLAQAGISILGMSVDPALFAFFLVAVVFGGLNILEYKRFD